MLATACTPEEVFPAGRGLPIVGGTAADESYLPAVGALVAFGQGMGGQVFVMPFCTGTLISDRLILSAAHCVEAIGDELPAGIPIGFFAGSNTKTLGASSKVLRIRSWHAHPDYKGGTPPGQLSDWADISVLELESPTSIAPLKLVRPAEVGSLVKPGASVLVVGYGLTNPQNQYSSGAKYYGTTTVQQVGSSEIWVTTKGGPQQCSGDSGGPTLEETPAGSGDYRILAALSRGDEGCAFGSVSTRVDPYLGWIHGFGTIPCGSGLSEDCAPPRPKAKLGDACADEGECEGKLCIGAPGERVCSQPCGGLSGSSCPDGYSCAQVAGSGDNACQRTEAPPPEPPPPPPEEPPEQELEAGATDPASASGCSIGPLSDGAAAPVLFVVAVIVGLARRARRRAGS